MTDTTPATPVSATRRTSSHAGDQTEPAPALASGLGPILVGGVATSVAMWTIAFAAHLPGLVLPTLIWGPLLVLTWIAGSALVARAVEPSRSLVVGAASGLLAGLINLLVLAPWIAELSSEGEAAPGFEGLPASWPVILLGFMLLGAVIGVAGGLLGRLSPKRVDAAPGAWAARYAVVCVIATAPLLLLGGLVTSTESGMAVPDWPGTFGSNMFTFPLELMVAEPRVFMEHSHRLFGALLGLTVVLLAAASFLLIRPLPAGRALAKAGPLRWWAIGILLAVSLQGYLGGARVTENNQFLAAAHGIFAQIVFALTGALAGVLWIRAFGAGRSNPTRSRTLSLVLGVALIIQLTFGALYRHLDSTHSLWTHAGFAIVVAVLAAIAGFTAMREADKRVPMQRLGGTLVGLVVFQFILGWVAAYFVLSAGERGPIPTADQLETATDVPLAEALVTTAHQATGAGIALVAALLIVWTRRWPSRP